MKRREWLRGSAAWGVLAAVPLSAAGLPGQTAAKKADGAEKERPLTPPPEGVPVAFLVSEGAVVIDFCGPWEVFQDANVSGREEPPFRLYTVAETMDPIVISGGMKIVPNYTFRDAPAPKVVVIPAQGGRSDAVLEWIRASAKTADVTMSVCTGAFLLARTGLLSGRAATTHHGSYKPFALQYPDIRVRRGARFVEDGPIASAGGLCSGMDLALRVVERYYGKAVAEETAYQMEYQGQGWTNAGSNALYAQVRQPKNGHQLCPVCDMEVDPATAPSSVYKGKTYFFCQPAHKKPFDEAPEKWL